MYLYPNSALSYYYFHSRSKPHTHDNNTAAAALSATKYKMDHFFKPNRIYAVVGASAKPEKFGYKVFKWYKDRSLNAIPININGGSVLDTPALKSISEIDVPKGSDIAISVITPPAVTVNLIETLQKSQLPVKAIWLQPGTHSPDTDKLASKLPMDVINDCILVNGDRYLSRL